MYSMKPVQMICETPLCVVYVDFFFRFNSVFVAHTCIPIVQIEFDPPTNSIVIVKNENVRTATKAKHIFISNNNLLTCCHLFIDLLKIIIFLFYFYNLYMNTVCENNLIHTHGLRNRLNFDNYETFLSVIFFFVFFANRYLATSKSNEAQKKSTHGEKTNRALVPNKSFVANFFRGKVESSQVFPYPYHLTEEEGETLSMVIDPVTRFFTVR